jgi:hypothetical protein
LVGGDADCLFLRHGVSSAKRRRRRVGSGNADSQS